MSYTCGCLGSHTCGALGSLGAVSSNPVVASPLDFLQVTSPFGSRREPTPGASTQHQGVDLRAAVGTPVRAPFGGAATSSFSEGGGNSVTITSPEGWKVTMRHLSRVFVSNQSVGAGTVVGEAGATGRVSGPHLHLELHPPGSGPVDPMPFLTGSPGRGFGGGSTTTLVFAAAVGLFLYLRFRR